MVDVIAPQVHFLRMSNAFVRGRALAKHSQGIASSLVLLALTIVLSRLSYCPAMKNKRYRDLISVAQEYLY